MHFLDTRAVSFIVFYYSFLSSVLTQFLWFCLHREVYLIGGLIHKSVGFTKQIWMHVCHGHHLASSGTFLYECFALKWSKTTLHQPNKMWILVVFLSSLCWGVSRKWTLWFLFFGIKTESNLGSHRERLSHISWRHQNLDVCEEPRCSQGTDGMQEEKLIWMR